VEGVLHEIKTLEVMRYGNCVVARTNFGCDKRVALVGHLDTVPVSQQTNNFPCELREIDGETIVWGRGTVDMKAGDAVFLAIAAATQKYSKENQPKTDLTFVFYDNEEVEASKNGLGHLVKNHPEVLQADFAILGEPTEGEIEAGCNGTLRFDLITHGKTAHSARAFMGKNAVHLLEPILHQLNFWNQEMHEVEVDGVVYREGLNAVKLSAGIATNMIPDKATLHLNYRFAPSKSVEDAQEYVASLFLGLEDLTAEELVLEHEIRSKSGEYSLIWKDLSNGARPGLDDSTVQKFVTAVKASTGGEVRAKLGWTDVARFGELGIPAVNFAPGDPKLAHHDEEFVAVANIEQVFAALSDFVL
jgi:succinyl-diaminopimelate desuccinylase